MLTRVVSRRGEEEERRGGHYGFNSSGCPLDAFIDICLANIFLHVSGCLS